MPATSHDLVTELTLRHATRDDLPAVLALLAETARWLGSLGVRQWPAGGFPAERIEPLIGAGTLYLLDDGGLPAATIALDGHADPEFWTPADRPDEAMYVHKLAVSRAHAGRALGEALLDWAALHADALGRRWLRLDCAKGNPRLQAYYRAAGFRHVRTVDLPHRASGALFERRAAALLDRPAPGAFRGRADTGRHDTGRHDSGARAGRRPSDALVAHALPGRAPERRPSAPPAAATGRA